MIAYTCVFRDVKLHWTVPLKQRPRLLKLIQCIPNSGLLQRSTIRSQLGPVHGLAFTLANSTGQRASKWHGRPGQCKQGIAAVFNSYPFQSHKVYSNPATTSCNMYTMCSAGHSSSPSTFISTKFSALGLVTFSQVFVIFSLVIVFGEGDHHIKPSRAIEDACNNNTMCKP